MKEKIDLHIHTCCSDGEKNPKSIIDEAVKNKVSVISITDHDTTAAYTEELLAYAKKNNITLIPGVEISTVTKKAGIHILGYFIDIHNQELQNTLKKLENVRHDYLHNVSDALKKLGYHIHTEELDQIKTVSKSHIANDIVTNPLNEQQLLHDFNHIPSKGEFIETMMNEGCPAYVKKNTISPLEAAKIIRKSGGKVVLAHPVAYKYEDNFTEQEILQIIQDINADGIEAYYIYINRNQDKIDETKLWNEFAKKHHLKTTVGSDFHKKDNFHPSIGLIEENISYNAEEITNWLSEKKH